MADLSGRVALVTGATRGIGKGIAVELGAAGATVWFTGRTPTPGASLPGSLAETAEEVATAGGVARPATCDHHHDAEVADLVERINAESGRLDVLVNNVYSSPDLGPWLGQPFWALPVQAWDQVIDIGVRSHYVMSALAAPLMLAAGEGLIVNVSSPGAVQYMHNVVYGVGKAALDRLTADCAYELAPHGVTAVSLWPGITRTEFTARAPGHDDGTRPLTVPGEGLFDLRQAESTRFSGRAVVALATDPEVIRHAGRPLSTADLAEIYGFTDVDGRIPRVSRVKQGPAGAPVATSSGPVGGTGPPA